MELPEGLPPPAMGEWERVDPKEHARMVGRIARWEARREARDAGGETLSLGELGALIKRTEAEAAAAGSEMERAAILLRLDDMHREFSLRTFLEEDVTEWPVPE